MIKGARPRYQASLEELTYEPSRGLNKSLIASLATCHYITKGESVLISGATGCGKSYLASALGQQACLNGHSVIYSNTQKFMLRTKMSRADGTILKYFDKLQRHPFYYLMILDLQRWISNSSSTLSKLLEIGTEKH